MKRVATALVLVPVLTWIILAGPPWLLAGALAAVGLAAFYEYDRLVAEHGFLPAGLPGMAAGLAFLLLPSPGIVAVVVAIAGLLVALRAADLKQVLPGAGAFVLGVLYIFGSWRCALELHEMNRHWLMFALLINWAGDTAALYVGRPFGRHKLAPVISPKKSWEGAAASVAGGLLAGALYMHYFLPAVPLIVILGVAAAGNAAGQMGDLCESALKRGAGVKDSGSFLPGHGGWLDRIDSSLFSVPVVYALVRFVVSS